MPSGPACPGLVAPLLASHGVSRLDAVVWALVVTGQRSAALPKPGRRSDVADLGKIKARFCL